MLIASVAIYVSSAGFRKDDFYNRIENKAINTARLLIEVEEIDAGLLKKIEADNPIGLPEEKIIILNYRNDTLYSSDDKGEISITDYLINSIRLEGRTKFTHGRSEILGLLYTEKYDRFVVIAAATDHDGLQKLQNLRLILFVVCLTSLILFSVVGWFFAGKALEPISGVVGKVEEISISSLNLRVDGGNGTDEIARLAKTFNKMLERLEYAFKRQKDFISNASHELRTPLTSINGQLEVLLMKGRPETEYKNAVKSVLEDTRNLTDLLNRLLLLTNTSYENPNINSKPLRVDEMLWQTKEELQKFNKDFRINISLSSSATDPEKIIIQGDEYLLKTAFANIMDNACKFSDDHSVEIRLENKENRLIIYFEDKGIGIYEKDLQHIFAPFHRGENVNAPGHGIGLSLVSQIIKNHNGFINIVSTAGKGTSVELAFLTP